MLALMRMKPMHYGFKWNLLLCWDLVCKRCRPWQDLNLHTTRRDLNPQFLNPKSNAPSMKPRAALPLSYMVAKHSGVDSLGVVNWLQPCSTQTWLTCAIWWKCLSFSTKFFLSKLVCRSKFWKILLHYFQVISAWLLPWWIVVNNTFWDLEVTRNSKLVWIQGKTIATNKSSK